MNHIQYAQLESNNNFGQMASDAAATVLDDTTRTLLWGYDTDRNSHHVYQHEDNIHVVVFGLNDVLISHVYGPGLQPDEVVPNKRLYPEMCDYDFCLQLSEQGVYLPFTNFSHERNLEDVEGLYAFSNNPAADAAALRGTGPSL